MVWPASGIAQAECPLSLPPPLGVHQGAAGHTDAPLSSQHSPFQSPGAIVSSLTPQRHTSHLRMALHTCTHAHNTLPPLPPSLPRPHTCADDGPRCSVIDHFFICLCGAGSGLKLDYLVLRQTEVHSFCVLQEEGNLEWVRSGEEREGIGEGREEWRER